jgi:hypothetical protein
MNEPIRIAMWSGPRNISTALMRSFGARHDTTVIDEPFYAAYLAATGLQHPMREEVIASQPQDWREVVKTLLGPVPDGKAIYYQKHMTHHMHENFGCEWIRHVRNAFLIRDPREVLASYVRKRGEVALSDIGVVRQRELFEHEADRLGVAPPVIDGATVLENPAVALNHLCAAIGIPFSPTMLSWPPGRRSTDGVWAPAWYDAVERSTCFAPRPEVQPVRLPIHLEKLAEQAMPHYEAIAAHRLTC